MKPEKRLSSESIIDVSFYLKYLTILDVINSIFFLSNSARILSDFFFLKIHLKILRIAQNLVKRFKLFEMDLKRKIFRKITIDSNDSR